MTDTTTTDAAESAGRRLIVNEFVTLDGYMAGPDDDMSWVAVGFDPQMHEDHIADLHRRAGLWVLGRATYDIFVAYWPHAVAYDDGDDVKPAEGREDGRVIRALNERPKLVFSTTLTDPAWANTRVVATGLEDEIKRLEHEPGPAMVVQGSASVVQALARADLVDEYRLYVHPVLLGAGTPLFAPGRDRHDRQDLELTGLTRYANGVVLTTYERRSGTDR